MARKITEVEIVMLQKLQKLFDNDHFLHGFMAYLETDEERQFMIDAIDKELVKDPSHANMLSLDIDTARKKYRGKKGYLDIIKLPYKQCL